MRPRLWLVFILPWWLLLILAFLLFAVAVYALAFIAAVFLIYGIVRLGQWAYHRATES